VDEGTYLYDLAAVPPFTWYFHVIVWMIVPLLKAMTKSAPNAQLATVDHETVLFDDLSAHNPAIIVLVRVSTEPGIVLCVMCKGAKLVIVDVLFLAIRCSESVEIPPVHMCLVEALAEVTSVA